MQTKLKEFSFSLWRKERKVSYIQRGGFFIKMYGLFWPKGWPLQFSYLRIHQLVCAHPYNIYPSILCPGHKSTNMLQKKLQNSLENILGFRSAILLALIIYYRKNMYLLCFCLFILFLSFFFYQFCCLDWSPQTPQELSICKKYLPILISIYWFCFRSYFSSFFFLCLF